MVEDIDKKKTKDVVRKIHTERRNKNLLNHKIWKRHKEKVAEVVDMTIKICQEISRMVCTEKHERNRVGEA